MVQVHPNGKQPSFTLALGNAVRGSLEDAGVWLCVKYDARADLSIPSCMSPYSSKGRCGRRQLSTETSRLSRPAVMHAAGKKAPALRTEKNWAGKSLCVSG